MALIAEESEPVVLVGHSRSGIAISEVAERIPERIRSLVYLTAALVPHGDTLSATRMRTLPDSAQEWPAIIADGTITLPRETVRPLFYKTTDAGWAARAEDRIGGEPISIMNTPLQLSEQRFGSVRRAYIECTEDQAVPIAAQRAMQKVLPCEPVITLETDHAPFYSNPEALTSALLLIERSTQSFSHPAD